MRQILSFLYTLVSVLCCLSATAQNYPVQVQVIAKPPYTNYLADLTNPASDRLYVTLLLKDLQLANRQIRLKTYIEGPGTRIIGRDNIVTTPVNLLPGSMIQLTGSDLAVYFRPENLQIPPDQYARALPEGMYRFCFTVYDYQTNLQLSTTTCSNFAWLQRSDPPLIVLPTANQLVPAMPAQQVLFQWVPRHSQVNAVDYELTLTEIILPQGFTANPQNLFFSQPPFFTTRTSGTTYLYGPASPPLTQGRLYGFRVRAVPKLGSEGLTSFTNDGYSQVGFFGYGYGAAQNLMITQSLQKKNDPVSTTDNIAKTMKGRVVWTFKKTELEPDTAKSNWVVKTVAQASAETTRRVESPAEKSNVANSLENAQVTILANGRTIGSAKTDKDGNYEIKGFNPDALQGVTSLTVRAAYTEDFTSTSRTVAIQRGQAEYDLGQNVLIAQTFRLATQIASSDIPKEELTLKVLRLKDIVNRFKYLAQEGNGNRDDVTYNGQSYVSVATVSSSQAARRIFYNTTGGDQFVVQALARGKSPMYFPLSAINTTAVSEGNKALLWLKRNYTYKSTISIAGKVGVKIPAFTAREGVRILVSVSAGDLLSPSANGAGFSKEVTSDKSGQYTLIEIPLLKKGAQIKLEATDYTLSPVAQTETIPFSGSEVIEKDITLRATVSLVAGMLKDQYGKPIPAGLVKIQATGQVIRANEYGFFIAKAYGSGQIGLTIAAPGFDEKSATYTPNRFSWNERVPDENGKAWERTLINYPSVKELVTVSGQPTLSADLLGYRENTIPDVFARLCLPNEQLGGMADAGIITIRNQQGLIRFVTTIDAKPITARMEVSNGKSGETGGKGWEYIGAGDVLSYKVVPADNMTPYLPLSGEVTVTPGEEKTITLALEKAVVLKGKITQKEDKKAIADAKVEIQDLPYSTTSDASGNYRFYAPYNREVRIRAMAKNFETGALKTTLADNLTRDFELTQRDTTLPELKTVLGYTVNAEKMERVSDKTVKVSGTLTLPTGNAFESDGAKFLTFNDVVVDVNDEGDGRPTKDVIFKETELELKAFKYAPVKLESRSGLILKRLVAEQTVGLIGGIRLRLNTERIQEVQGFNLSLLPRTSLSLIDPNDEKGKVSDLTAGVLKDFQTAFSNLKSFPAVVPTAQYKLSFDQTQTQVTGLSSESLERLTKDSEKYFPLQVTFLTFLFDKEKCALSAKGIDFKGKVRLPQVTKFKFLNEDVEIEKFSIGQKLELKEASFKISDTAPLEAKMGGWHARLTKLIVYDNFNGVGFGGRIGSTDKKENDWTIDKLYYIRQGTGLKVGGKITFPKEGYKVSSLKFNTPEGFEVAYISSKKAFEIDGTLKVDYTGTAKSSVFTLFPLEVQRFTYRSNQEMLVAVKANASLKMGPVKINVRRFLFNRGVKMSFEEMNKLMVRDSTENANLSATRYTSTTTAAQTSVNDESLDKFDKLGALAEDAEVPFAEAQVSWGVGIAGGVDVDVRALQVKSDASVLVVENAGAVQVRVNEFLFLLDNSSFKAEIRAKTVYTDVRQGFEGSGSFETLSRKFACSFKYYKVGPADSDLELGLALVASANIPMGSVTWTQIGGAIDFSIKEKKYYVAFMGALTPTGVDKRMIEFDRVKVSLLFDLIECGSKPVIKGSAGVKINQIDWGIATVTLDICRTRLLADIVSDVEVLKGLAKLRINALLYAKPNMVFFGCNASLNIPKMGQANALIALGVNARRTEMPEGANIWSKISGVALDQNGEYFNGINVRADASLADKSGGYSINLGIGNASFAYRYWAKANMEFYYRFANNNFGFYARADIGGSASVNVLGLGLNGGASAGASLAGGYTDSRGWYFNGDARVNFYLDNDSGRGCNSASTRWCSQRLCIKYPCGKWYCPVCRWCDACSEVPYPCGVSFKLCQEVSASFSYSSR